MRCDVMFIVGEEKQEIKAHKMYLAEVSPAFEAMFYGAMKIRDESVAVPDISPTVFNALLRCIYSWTKPEIDECLLLQLFFAADKYDVAHVVDMTIEQLIEVNNEGDIIQAFTCCVGNRETTYKKFRDHILSNGEAFLTSENCLAALNKEVLLDLVQQDLLKIDELVLLRQLVRWAELHIKVPSITLEKKRETLKEFLPHVRLPTIGVDFFKEEQLTQLFSRDDIEKALKYRTSPSLVVDSMSSLDPGFRKRGFKPIRRILERKVGSCSNLTVLDEGFHDNYSKTAEKNPTVAHYQVRSTEDGFKDDVEVVIHDCYKPVTPLVTFTKLELQGADVIDIFVYSNARLECYLDRALKKEISIEMDYKTFRMLLFLRARNVILE